MATRIIEYVGEWSGSGKPPCLPTVASVVQSPLTASGVSQQSSAFNAATQIVVIDTDQKIHVAFGANPTATTDYLAIPAGGVREFNVTAPGQKVAIIQGS